MAAGTGSAGGDNLSLATLVIAALASAAAAVLVSQFSESGSAMAAALTAIFVPLLREAFHRPARVISEKRPVRRSGPSMAAAAGAGAALSGAERQSEPASDRTETAAASPGRESTAVASGDARTRPLEADGGEPGRWGGADDRAPGLFGAPGGVPADMLEREDDEAGPPAREAETRRFDGDEHETTSRLEGDDALSDAEARRLDPHDSPVEYETRRLEGETAPLDPETRTRALGGASAGARAPGRDAGANGAAPSRSPGGPAGAGRVLGRRPRVRIAILTGLLAFVLAAVVLTVPELIAGGSVGGGEGRTTLFSGGGSSDSGSDDAVEDGVLDGDGGSSADPGDEGGSSDPVPGGGGASEDDGDSGGGGAAGEDSAPAPPSNGGGAAERSGDGSAPAPQAAPSGGDAPSP